MNATLPTVQQMQAANDQLTDAYDALEELVIGLDRYAREHTSTDTPPTLETLGAAWILADALARRSAELAELQAQLEAAMPALDAIRTDAPIHAAAFDDELRDLLGG
jgi:hypothetical protein